jgi:hypothetical protein
MPVPGIRAAGEDARHGLEEPGGEAGRRHAVARLNLAEVELPGGRPCVI